MQVPEPRFYLKNPKDINETLICMQAKYCGQRVFISTGEKVKPSEWDFNKQRATVSRKNLSASTVNMFLDRIVSTFKEIFRELLVIHDLPPAEIVTDKLLQKIDEAYVSVEVKPKEKITFYKFIEQYIDECRPLKSLGTIKTYQSTYKHLSNYSKLKGCDFDFPDITISWRSGFLQYLQSTGSSKNTEGKHIKNIKVFLNEATERGLNSNLEFRSKSFSKPSEDVEKVFLTDEEIASLINLDLSNDRLKAIVRDYYIISCYTSLRYSDFVSIRPEHIKENTIEMRTQKTGEDVIIPIAPVKPYHS